MTSCHTQEKIQTLPPPSPSLPWVLLSEHTDLLALERAELTGTSGPFRRSQPLSGTFFPQISEQILHSIQVPASISTP